MNLLFGLFLVPFFLFSEQSGYYDIEMDNIKIKTHCDQVLVYSSQQNPLQKRCYDYNLRESKLVLFKLNKDTIDRENIKKRPGFTQDRNIPKKYRVSNTCYTHTGYDRGHQAFDQGFDYNWLILKTTFKLSNIVPERPKTNRVTQRKIENLIMNITRNHKSTIVLVGIIGGNKRLKDLERCPIIPKNIYEIVWVKDNDKYVFVKMYIIDNETGDIDKIIFDENKMKQFLKNQNIELK